MTNNFLERFTEWQNYVHYIMLTFLVSGIVLFFELYGLPFWKMVGFLILIIFIADSLIHAIFWFLPEPFRWRD